MMKYMNLTYLKNNVFMINSGFSVRQNQDSECHVSEIEFRSSAVQYFGFLIHQQGVKDLRREGSDNATNFA